MLSKLITETHDKGHMALSKPGGQAGAEAGERIATLERTIAELQERLGESDIRYRYAYELSHQIPWMAAPNGDVLELPWLWTTLRLFARFGGLGWWEGCREVAPG